MFGGAPPKVARDGSWRWRGGGPGRTRVASGVPPTDGVPTEQPSLRHVKGIHVVVAPTPSRCAERPPGVEGALATSTLAARPASLNMSVEPVIWTPPNPSWCGGYSVDHSIRGGAAPRYGRPAGAGSTQRPPSVGRRGGPIYGWSLGPRFVPERTSPFVPYQP